MPRFFCSGQHILRGTITLSDKSQLNHLKNVLRLKPKDKVVVFDESGSEYACIIEKIDFQAAQLKVINKKMPVNIPKVKITIACAIPKKSKIDDIIDKLTQLGVERIIPLLTERVIVKLDKNKAVSRGQRWEKIAISSSKQCQRSKLPVIDPVKSLPEVLSEAESFDLKLIPNLEGKRRLLKEVVKEYNPKNILVLIGPEGDFTPQEIALAYKHGCISVSLGELVLRVETAAVAVASFIRFYADS